MKDTDGGAFLIGTADADSVFIAEEFNEEQKLFAQSAEDFIRQRVMPVADKLEAKDYDLHLKLFRELGELDLLKGDIPEIYGGLNLDKISTALINEKLAGNGSFATTVADQTGIGSLPILYFGTEEQKKKYLPKLASGEHVGAYALTETESGSDAMSLKTTAKPSDDGKYWVLNGSKQFITNAAFFDVMTVYARTENGISAFIVEKDAPGMSIGQEEHKMGIRGSSTCSIFFDDCRIPKENLLGEKDKGHLIAFNILNIGRYKLGVASLGAAKYIIEEAIKYAKERVQFGQPIANFGMIKEKLADMAIGIWSLEGMAYRNAGLLENALHPLDPESPDFSKNALKQIAGYAVECSITKVYGSEILWGIADETVQIFGGYGFVEDYPAERFLRDSRINRIFEGTNEINRLLIPAMIMKKAMKGELPLIEEAAKISNEIVSIMPRTLLEEGDLAVEKLAVDMSRKIMLAVLGLVVKKYGEKLKDEEELLGRLADIVIALYTAETAVIRAQKLAGSKKADWALILAQLSVAELFSTIYKKAQEIAAVAAAGDMQKITVSAFRKLYRWYQLPDLISLKRKIADELIKQSKYCF